MTNIVDYARKRYTTKHYDKSQKLTTKQMQDIKELLQLAPSSVNIQPWHFIIATTAEGKARIAKSTEGLYDFNKDKVLDAPITVVFCSRTKITDDYLQHLTDKEREDGRFDGNKEIEEAGHKGRVFFTDLHRKTRNDLSIWTANQTYLNIGAFLLGVAAMGLDATPIEGFNQDIFDKEFKLQEKGLEAVCFVTVGHRTAHDGNATRPKSRLEEKELVSEI